MTFGIRRDGNLSVLRADSRTGVATKVRVFYFHWQGREISTAQQLRQLLRTTTELELNDVNLASVVPGVTHGLATFRYPCLRVGQLTGWRREWDSNPRYGCPYTRFPSVRLQPLGHPSAGQGTGGI